MSDFYIKVPNSKTIYNCSYIIVLLEKQNREWETERSFLDLYDLYIPLRIFQIVGCLNTKEGFLVGDQKWRDLNRKYFLDLNRPLYLFEMNRPKYIRNGVAIRGNGLEILSVVMEKEGRLCLWLIRVVEIAVQTLQLCHVVE